MLHHHDAVGLEHRGQPVCDHQRGAPRHQALQRLLHRTLALRVQRAGGLVQQQDRRVLEQRTRDRDALLLAT